MKHSSEDLLEASGEFAHSAKELMQMLDDDELTVEQKLMVVLTSHGMLTTSALVLQASKLERIAEVLERYVGGVSGANLTSWKVN